MSHDSVTLDLSNAKHRQMLVGWIKSLKGFHHISIKQVRANRSLDQNAYYWGVVLPAVANGLQEAWGEAMSVDDCHEWLKARFNSRVLVNKATGEVKGRQPQSTANLDTKEFGEYLDKVIKFAGEQLGVEVPEAVK